MPLPVATPPGLSPEERSRLTYRIELLRGSCSGILEAGLITFGLLVAIRQFAAGEFIQAAIPASTSLGLLLTPLTLYWVSRGHGRPTRAMAEWLLAGGVALALAGFAPGVGLFAGALIVASVALSQQSPFLVAIYTRNYAPHERGTKMSFSTMLGVTTGAVLALFGGRMLDAELALYPIIFFTMALAAVLSAWLVRQIPTEPLGAGNAAHPLRNLSLAWEDKLFGWLLISWMLMGLGNLMTLPLRVLYMADPNYGVDAGNEQIALLTVFVPSIARILSTHIWGRLFDKLDFIVLRTIINGLFLVGVFTFFFTTHFWVMTFASVSLGLAMGGGNVLWNLWVTRVSPPDKVSAYMSVHTALTGVRGTVAPFLGIYLYHALGAHGVSWIAALLIFLSMMMFSFTRRDLEARARGAG